MNRIAVGLRISGVYVYLLVQFSVQHVGYVHYVILDGLHGYFLYLVFDDFIYCVFGRSLGYFRYGALTDEHIAYVLDYLRHGHLLGDTSAGYVVVRYEQQIVITYFLCGYFGQL